MKTEDFKEKIARLMRGKEPEKPRPPIYRTKRDRGFFPPKRKRKR